MKAHRSLRQADVLRRGPSKIALMIASEFWRASSGADYESDVVACYQRARELMGILETIALGDEAAAPLQSFYKRCIEKELLRPERLRPEFVRLFSAQAAEAFERAANLPSLGALPA